MSKAQKEMRQAMERAVELENHVQELQAERCEQDAKISSLENRCMSAQREATCLRDLHDKLENSVNFCSVNSLCLVCNFFILFFYLF